MTRPANADRVEDGGLDGDLGRGIGDFALRAAHDAGNTDGARRVRDDQRVWGQLAIDVVQRLEPLSGVSQADDDRSVVNRGAVEGVRGLAQLEHDVVRGVDDVADRAHAGGLKPHLDGVRRGADLRAADPAADESGAQPGLQNLDLESVSDGASGLLDHDLRPANRCPRGCSDLASQSDQAQRIASIGLDVDVQHDVAVQVRELAAERRGGRQDEDALGVGRDLELVARAEHPFRRDAHLLGAFDTAVAGQDGTGQSHGHALARGDVVCPAHDMKRFAGTDVDGGQVQSIGVGMLLDGQQLTYDDRTPVGTPLLDLLDFHAQERQTLGELLGCLLDVDVLTQPAQRDSHRNCSRKRRSFSR